MGTVEPVVIVLLDDSGLVVAELDESGTPPIEVEYNDRWFIFEANEGADAIYREAQP